MESFGEGAKSNRYWFITYNNPSEDWKADLKAVGGEWSVGQLEQGQSGTVHIQALLWFKERIGPKYFKGRKCWAKSISPHDVTKVIEYCTKEDTRLDGPVEFGKKPFSKQASSRRTGRDWDSALTLAKEGRVKEIEAGILIPYIKNLQSVSALFSKTFSTDLPRGLWVYGKPGFGKSHYVRSEYPDAYFKAQNKWWDGYNGEKFVILDDLDEHGVCLGHHWKIYLDQYSFIGEIKGGFIIPQYVKFIVTSNYLPSNLWPNCPTGEAIQRRCKFVIFYEPRKFIVGSDYGVIPAIPSYQWELKEFIAGENKVDEFSYLFE